MAINHQSFKCVILVNHGRDPPPKNPLPTFQFGPIGTDNIALCFVTTSVQIYKTIREIRRVIEMASTGDKPLSSPHLMFDKDHLTKDYVEDGGERTTKTCSIIF